MKEGRGEIGYVRSAAEDALTPKLMQTSECYLSDMHQSRAWPVGALLSLIHAL